MHREGAYKLPAGDILTERQFADMYAIAQMSPGPNIVIVTLIVLLGFEFALLRPGISPDNLRRVTNVDAGYGAAAGLNEASGSTRSGYREPVSRRG